MTGVASMTGQAREASCFPAPLDPVPWLLCLYVQRLVLVMEKSFRGNLPYWPLCFSLPSWLPGRFLVFTSFSCNQVKGGLDEVIHLRDVNCASDCPRGRGRVLGREVSSARKSGEGLERGDESEGC